MTKESLRLYRWNFDCGRMGLIEGTFAAYQSEIDNAIGNVIYLGEVLGKAFRYLWGN